MKINELSRWAALVTGLLMAGTSLADNETNGPAGPDKDLSGIGGTIPQVEPAPIWSIATQMPEVPNAVPLFEVQPIDPTNPGPLVQAMMQRFEFDPEQTGFEEDENGLASVMHTDPNRRTIEVFRSGASFYMEESLFPEQAGDLFERFQLQPGEASEFFESYATNLLSELGLQREGLQFDKVSFAHLKTVEDGGNDETTKVIGAAAKFGYALDGIPLAGPGAKTTVFFGENGPAGLYDAMPVFEPVDTVELLEPAQVVADYIAADEPQSIYRLYTGVVDETVIEEVKLTYYVGPGNEDQGFIEPYYEISGTMYGWNPGPDPENPREGSTTLDPSPFLSRKRAYIPAPEPGLVAGLAVGVMALAGRRPRRRAHAPD